MTCFRFSRAVLATVVAVAGMAAVLQRAQADPPLTHRLKYYASRDFNARVLNFAKSQVGKQVGDGECWTLAHDALAAAGAKRPGQELGTYVFGSSVPLLSVRPGDILQFENVKFVSPSGAWQQFSHHTAIVTSDHAIKGTIIVLHQNVNGSRTVQYGRINLSERQGGTILAFRPVAR